MPITLSPVSRRRFLAGSLAAGAGLALGRSGWGAEAAADANRFALLSDVHIDRDKATHDRDVVMYDHLKQAVAEVLALSPAPAAVMVNGDCAYLHGREADYRRFVELMQPVREAGRPVHLSMGNHDDRPNFWKVLPADQQRVNALEDRQVLAIESPRADWVMLDSLDKTNQTPGVLGARQLEWLTKELDARKEKRVIVMVHHQPDFRAKVSGLTDSQQLLDVLLPRKQVKALLYGHTHEWRVEKRDDLHCINLPAVAYVFKTGEPSGWVDATVGDSALTLKLQCLDKSHPRHGEKHELTWRG
jgi:3',5'-cyclic-AMP phosphodiesterase